MIKNGRAIGNVTKDSACITLQNLQTFSLFFNSTTNCEVVISLLLGIIRIVKIMLPPVTAIIYTKLKRKSL